MAENTERPAISQDRSLRETIAFTSEKTIDALIHYQDLMLQQGPRIKADYAIKIGCYENEQLTSVVEVRRAKRKLELVEAALDAGEQVDAAGIESQLDMEFDDYVQRTKAVLSDYLSLLEWWEDDKAMTLHDRNELKRVFRRIISRLAPDIHPNQNDTEVRLFMTAQQAYQRGDLPTLRAIEVTSSYVDSNVRADDKPSAREDEAYLSMLEEALSTCESRIAALEDEFPFSFASKLADRDWVDTRVKEITEQTVRNGREAASFRRRTAALLSNRRD